MLECPVCGYPLYCGCPACVDLIPPGFVPEIHRGVEGIEIYGCPLCGFKQSGDWWLDYEIEQLKRDGKWPKEE